jgi:hypothetical protein
MKVLTPSKFANMENFYKAKAEYLEDLFNNLSLSVNQACEKSRDDFLTPDDLDDLQGETIVDKIFITPEELDSMDEDDRMNLVISGNLRQ